jgi:cytochrome c-type biogenesis protein
VYIILLVYDLWQIVSFIVFAALADSIDPCIFALYTSLLLSASIGGLKRVSRVATAFISSVYIGYLIFGAILKLLFNLTNPPRWVLSAILLCYGVAMLIYTLLASDEGFDIAVCREDRAVCRLAKKLRLDAIDPNRYGVVGIVLLGFIASFTLMPCSAGLYVTFNIITKDVGFAAWLPLACLYTAFFVLPLIIIAVAVIGLTKISPLYKYALSKQRFIKIAASIIMMAIALYILFTAKGSIP